MIGVLHPARIAILGLLLALPASPATAAPVRWNIRPGYSAVHFEAKHLLVVPVRGSLAVRGAVYLDDQDLASSRVEATSQVRTLYSGNEARDAWLKSAAFFDAERYPSLSFTSTAVERSPAGVLLVTGVLSCHGKSRPVTFEVDGPTAPMRDADGRLVRAVTARATIDRKDFGLRWQKELSGGGVALSDEVKLEITLELVASGE